MDHNNTSFDDLDSVEVISLNHHNVTKLRQQQQQNQQNQHLQQQQQHRPILSKKGVQHTLKNPYFYSVDQQNIENGTNVNDQFQPISILKRFDSNEKMYPINRPSQSQTSFHHSGGGGGTLPKNFNSHMMMNETASSKISKFNNGSEDYYGSSNNISEKNLRPQQQAPTRKKVQFANTLSMLSASSDGDLSACNPKSSSRSSKVYIPIIFFFMASRINPIISKRNKNRNYHFEILMLMLAKLIESRSIS